MVFEFFKLKTLQLCLLILQACLTAKTVFRLKSAHLLLLVRRSTNGSWKRSWKQWKPSFRTKSDATSRFATGARLKIRLFILYVLNWYFCFCSTKLFESLFETTERALTIQANPPTIRNVIILPIITPNVRITTTTTTPLPSSPSPHPNSSPHKRPHNDFATNNIIATCHSFNNPTSRNLH